MSLHLLDWTWTAVMLGATVFWTLVLRRCLRDHDGLHTESSRIFTLATLTIVCALSLLSSLLYADLLAVEDSRFLISMSRVALLVGGAAVWWTGRPREDA